MEQSLQLRQPHNWLPVSLGAANPSSSMAADHLAHPSPPSRILEGFCRHPWPYILPAIEVPGVHPLFGEKAWGSSNIKIYMGLLYNFYRLLHRRLLSQILVLTIKQFPTPKPAVLCDSMR